MSEPADCDATVIFASAISGLSLINDLLTSVTAEPGHQRETSLGEPMRQGRRIVRSSFEKMSTRGQRISTGAGNRIGGLTVVYSPITGYQHGVGTMSMAHAGPVSIDYRVFNMMNIPKNKKRRCTRYAD